MDAELVVLSPGTKRRVRVTITAMGLLNEIYFGGLGLSAILHISGWSAQARNVRKMTRVATQIYWRFTDQALHIPLLQF